MTDQRPAASGEAVETAASALVETWLAASKHHLPAAQLRALQAVQRNPGLTVAELAVQLGTIASWASRLCDRLEAEGYLERKASGHGRHHLQLRVRPDGLRLLESLSQQRRAALDEVLGAMTGPERAALLRGLRGFTRAAGACQIPETADRTA